jgi:hypothetical protein
VYHLVVWRDLGDLMAQLHIFLSSRQTDKYMHAVLDDEENMIKLEWGLTDACSQNKLAVPFGGGVIPFGGG